MKILYCALLSFLLPVLTPKAQIVQSSGSAKIVEYQSPKDGDDFVPEQTTLIIRLSKKYIAGHSASDFSFVVQGEKSGRHYGKVIIADDGQTVIFQPDVPFSLHENVKVRLFVLNDKDFSFIPVSYQFTTTSMSETERSRALYELHQQWHAEEQEMMNKAPESPEGVPHSKGTDTIAFSPAVVVIDTITNHEDGNIFFAPMGIANAQFAFLAITSDTASKAPQTSNSFLFERDIPKGCGNFLMQPDGSMTYFQEFSAPGGGVFAGQIVHLDPRMNVIDTFQCKNGFTADLHDFHLLPNHHRLLLAYYPQKVNMKKYLDTVQGGAYSSISAKASDTATVFGAIIQEQDEHNNVVLQWRSWDFFQITDATIDIDLTKPVIDYMHINTADIDSTDGNILASFRHCDEVSKINHGDLSFVWRMGGGKHNQFTFGGSLDPRDTTPFSHQHDPARIANGHITLFDNGNLRLKDTTINGKDTIVNHPYSRALEYNVDETNHTATVVWEYDSIPYCAAAGNVQRLDNGNTMIGLGITVQPSAVEVTPEGNKVFQMSIQKGSFSYRTYRFPFTPPLAVRQIGNANAFGLASIYPNPAQNSATVSFSVASPGLMQIELLDILGHSLRTISERLPNSGSYTADLDVNELPAGTYYCKLSQNGSEMVKMMVVAK